MDEQIELEVKYTVDDYVRSLSFMQSRLPLNKYGFVIFPAIIFLSIIVYSLFSSKEGFELDSLTFTNILAILIAVLFLFFLLLALRFFPNPMLKWSISRQFKSSPALQQTQHICFDEDGIKGQSSLGSGEAKWKAVIEAVESKEDFFFYTSKKFAQFVPKRCFSSEEQQNQLRDLVKRKLGDKAKF